MKKYFSLGEFLIDYRNVFGKSQLDIASCLDVDIRTISRWEKNETLVKSEKEKDLVRQLNIPHQVISNLNNEKPISIYYDLIKRIFSISALSQDVPSASWFKEDFLTEPNRIRLLSSDFDTNFVQEFQLIQKNKQLIRSEIIKEGAKILPEINLMLDDQAGFSAGHIIVLPLKYDSYRKLRNREIEEKSLQKEDLSSSFTEEPLIFYFYSLYADSLDNSYYLMNSLLSYFKKKKYRDYILAGISFRKRKVELLKEMGLKVIWDEVIEDENDISRYFLEGNLDMFLFGKMN